ncbi:MAG: hypothetical protein V1835_05690 [Candidatus Micrarchaeota archaeon]
MPRGRGVKQTDENSGVEERLHSIETQLVETKNLVSVLLLMVTIILALLLGGLIKTFFG